jgi:hypothetical protein
LRAASLKAIEPAILNAISEESTSRCTIEQDRHHTHHRVPSEHADLKRILDAVIDGRMYPRAGSDHR